MVSMARCWVDSFYARWTSKVAARASADFLLSSLKQACEERLQRHISLSHSYRMPLIGEVEDDISDNFF